MTGYLTPFAALAALIAKAFTSTRNRQNSAHLVELFPATARTTIQRSPSLQRDEGAPSRRRSIDRD
jgi:hypothetical protein